MDHFYFFFHIIFIIIKLTIKYKENYNEQYKKIMPIKSFILIDKIYLCCYDLIADKIDILEYSSIVYYIIDTFEIFNPNC